MRSLTIISAMSAVTAAVLALSAPAFADTVTTTGSVAAYCGVTVSNQAFNINTMALQRIADLDLKCNNKATATLTVAAANGSLKNGAITLPYSWGVDLQGAVNAFQSAQINGSTVPTSFGLFGGQELATGVPGHMTMIVKAVPWASGTYSETFTVTVG